MNERLKEIEKQATRRIETKVRKGGWDNDREPYEYKTVVDTFFDKEKFAELIVRECAEIGDNYQDILEDDPECFNCRKVAYGIVDKIKEHFGVKE